VFHVFNKVFHFLGESVMLRSNVVHVFMVLVVLAVAGTCGSARADFIAVPNFSFESPDVSADPFYHQYPNVNGPSSDAWAQPTGKANAGTFLNGHFGRNFSNLTGTQAGYLDVDVQEFTLYQDLSSATFEAGKKYTLTFGLGKAGTQTSDRAFDAYLFYRDGETQEIVTAGTPTVIHWANPSLSTTTLADFSASVAVQSTDAWAGKSIGILFRNEVLGTSSSGSAWCFDNVRLSSEPIPEPCALVLLGSGLIGLLAYAWRKRK
jgi:hypothetical protein